MEQDERAVVEPSKVSTKQCGNAGEAPASPESGEVAAASTGGVESEEREAFEDTIASYFEFRAAAADGHATPASFRSRSRGRNEAGPTKFVAAAAYESAGFEDPVLARSSSSAPSTGMLEDSSAVVDGDQGAAPGDDKKLERVFSAPGTTIAIAHASPSDSYRRVPWRSRKQYSPKRIVAAAGAFHSDAAPSASEPPPRAASALPSASASELGTAISSVIDASSSSSSRPPSRGRKQPRPEHFIPEEAEATASAKARRSDIVLDRFLFSVVHGTSASDSEWVSNVTEKDAVVRGQHQRGLVGFRIRDASRQAAHALSRLGCASPSCSSSPPGEPDGRGRFYGVLAVLGASLALCVVSCVLFYIVGQKGEPGPSAEKPNE